MVRGWKTNTRISARHRGRSVFVVTCDGVLCGDVYRVGVRWFYKPLSLPRQGHFNTFNEAKRAVCLHVDASTLNQALAT